MKDASNQSYTYWQNPLLRGSILGGVVLTAVTPGLNWTNQVIANNPFGWKNLFHLKAFSGAKAYASSAAPSYAFAFAVKKMLSDQVAPTTFNHLCCAFGAGAAAGFVLTPFEALAQSKQLDKSNSKNLLHTVIKQNGVSALLRGATISMFREGVWTASYMFAPSFFATYFQRLGLPEQHASTASALSFGALFGIFSAPLNVLRFHKQSGLTQPKENHSYLQLAKQVGQELPTSNLTARVCLFFKGAKPRAITAGTAAVLLHEGSKVYDKLTSKPR